MCALYSKLPSNMSSSTIPTIEMRNEECFIRIWSVYAVFSPEGFLAERTWVFEEDKVNLSIHSARERKVEKTRG